MEWLTTGTLGLVIIGCIWWFFKRRLNYWQNRGVPCIEDRSLYKIFSQKMSLDEGMQLMYDKCEGHAFGGYVQGITPTLLIRDAALVNQILIRDFTHFEDRGLSTDENIDPLNANVGNMTGDKWRSLRHKLTPMFTSGKLKGMFDQTVHCSDNVLKYLREKNEPFEARIAMQKFTVNTIGTVAFGLDIDTCKEDEETERFLMLSRRTFEPTLKTVLKLVAKVTFPKLSNFIRLRLSDAEVTEYFTKLGKESVKMREESGKRRNDFLQLLIDLRDKDRAGHSPSQIDSNNPTEELEKGDKDLIGQLKYMQRDSTDKYRFTDTSIVAHIFAFISAGIETTASSLTFILYHLAIHESIQTKLQEEVDSVLLNQEFTYSALKEMTSLDNFIDESLRLRPPAGSLMRECTKPYRLPNTDIIIEKGSYITIPVLQLHKDPRYFPDPEKFDPDRFVKKTHPNGSYLPFGDGPRSCIASRFSLFEMKVLVARLLMKYTIVLSEKTKMPLEMVKSALFQHVVGGIWVELKDR